MMADLPSRRLSCWCHRCGTGYPGFHVFMLHAPRPSGTIESDEAEPGQVGWMGGSPSSSLPRVHHRAPCVRWGRSVPCRSAGGIRGSMPPGMDPCCTAYPVRLAPHRTSFLPQRTCLARHLMSGAPYRTSLLPHPTCLARHLMSGAPHRTSFSPHPTCLARHLLSGAPHRTSFSPHPTCLVRHLM